MPFRTPIEEISRNIARLVLDKVDKNRSEIQYWSETLAKAEYADYSKRPVDTGESLAKTSTEVKVNYSKMTANLLYKIDTPQSVFFTDPKSPQNPNFKYGKRNPAKDSYEKHFKTLLTQILNSWCFNLTLPKKTIA